MMASLRIVVAVLSMFATVAVAHAENAAVLVGGAVSPVEERELSTAVRRAVQDKGWTVADVDLGSTSFAAFSECATSERKTTCLPSLITNRSVDRIVVIRVATEKYEGEDMRVLLGSVYRRAGDLLAAKSRYCRRCRQEILVGHARELALELIREANAISKPAILVIKSTPSNALVFVDGDEAGRSGLDLQVDSGRRLVRVEKPGFRTRELTIVLGDGAREVLEVELRPIDDTPTPVRGGPEQDGSMRKLLPWIAVGTGATMAVAGGVLFAFDGEQLDADGYRVPHYYNTTPAAITLTTAGVLVGGAGAAYLLFFRPSPRSPQPTVSVTAAGAWVGIRGSF